MSAPFRYQPDVSELPGEPRSVDEILALLRSHLDRVALDSAAGEPSRWSLVAFDPLEMELELGCLGDLRNLRAQVECDSLAEIPGPFAGGFLGALSYDLGVAGERAVWHESDPLDSPRIVGGLYVDFIVIDGELGKWWLVLAEERASDPHGTLAARRERIVAELQSELPRESEAPADFELKRHVSGEEHMRRVEAAREEIAAGEYYQANLAHRFSATSQLENDVLYRSLRAANPAPYMGFLEWGQDSEQRGAILSASPELLLEFDGSTALTRPIKGTAPRSGDRFEDAQLARDLLRSEKDRAELAMIVDLERNDLGRIARIGSVCVPEFPKLQSYATVHHLVADVECEVEPETDAIDVLQAIFPGGSITGAPKLAAMQAIAKHEGEGRGFFTGSLGFVDFRGRACFNILIRTLVRRGGEVSFHVGGGITWSSNAAAEERETLVKAKALIEALTRAHADRIST